MSLVPNDTFQPLEATAEHSAPWTPSHVGAGLRAEDALRLAVGGLLVFLGGLGLGSFTFHEVAGRGTGYFVVAACLAVVFTALAYYQFEACLLLFVGVVWMSFGQTPSLATGVSSGTGKTLYPVELFALFLLFIWGLRRFGNGQGRLVATPMNRPLVVYLAFSVWTAINGALFWDPAVAHYFAGLPGGGRTPPQVVVLELGLRVLSIGTFWMLASNLTSGTWLRRICFVFFVPGLLTCLSFYHLAPHLGGGWPTLLEVGLDCGLWAWLLEPHGPWQKLRPFAMALFAASVVHVFFFNITWISGWIALFVGLGAIAWLKSRRLFTGLLIGGVFLVLVSLPFLQAQVVHKVQTSGDLDRASMARGDVLYALHFPLGVGVGNYRAYNMYYGRPSVWNTTGYTSAHNFYGQSLSEMGFVGLALTVFWVVAGTLMLVRFYRHSPPGFERTMILAIGGLWTGLSVAACVGDYFIPVYYNGGTMNMTTTIYGWMGLGIAVALARRTGALEAQGKPAPAAPALPSASAYFPRRMTR